MKTSDTIGNERKSCKFHDKVTEDPRYKRKTLQSTVRITATTLSLTGNGSRGSGISKEQTKSCKHEVTQKTTK